MAYIRKKQALLSLFFRSCSQDRIRTCDQLINSQLRYRCATWEYYIFLFTKKILPFGLVSLYQILKLCQTAKNTAKNRPNFFRNLAILQCLRVFGFFPGTWLRFGGCALSSHQTRGQPLRECGQRHQPDRNASREFFVHGD